MKRIYLILPALFAFGVFLGALGNHIRRSSEIGASSEGSQAQGQANLRLFGNSDGGATRLAKSADVFDELTTDPSSDRNLRNLTDDLKRLHEMAGGEELTQERLLNQWEQNPEAFSKDLALLSKSEQTEILKLLSDVLHVDQAAEFFKSAHGSDIHVPLNVVQDLIQRWIIADPESAVTVAGRLGNPYEIYSLHWDPGFRDPEISLTGEIIDRLWNAEANNHVRSHFRSLMSGLPTNKREIKDALVKNLINPQETHVVEFMYYNQRAVQNVEEAIDELMSNSVMYTNDDLGVIAAVEHGNESGDPLSVLDHMTGSGSRENYFKGYFKSHFSNDFKGEGGTAASIEYAEHLEPGANRSSAIAAAYSVAAEKDPTFALTQALASDGPMAAEYRLNAIWESMGENDEGRTQRWNEAVNQLPAHERQKLNQVWGR